MSIHGFPSTKLRLAQDVDVRVPSAGLEERQGHAKGDQRTDSDDGADFHRPPTTSGQFADLLRGFPLFPTWSTPAQKNSPTVLSMTTVAVECDHDRYTDLNGLVPHPQTHFLELALCDSHLRVEASELQGGLA